MPRSIAIVARSAERRAALADALSGDPRWRVVEAAEPDGAADLVVIDGDATPAQLRATVAALCAGLDARSLDEPPGEPLTPRELEVFELVAKGYTNPDIAGALGISTHTAKVHVGQILAKIGAASRAEAVGIGLRLGLIGV